MKQSLGQKLEPILEEICNTLWEHDPEVRGLIEFSEKGLWYGTKIFMETLMDSMWKLQEKEGIDIESRLEMAQSLGEEIRKLVKNYTDKDTFEFWR